MRFLEKQGIRYFQFNSLRNYSLNHGIVTRHGGISPAPWNSLNIGSTVGDDPRLVRENLTRLFRAANIKAESVFDVWQVHGNTVLCTDKAREKSVEHQKADGSLTNKRGVTLLMRFADCTPILLFDPVKKVIGMVHAGWLGTVRQIPCAAIEKMVSCYNSSPKDIIACIGPSIGPEDYEVGKEVIDQVRRSFGEDSKELLRYGKDEDHAFFNMWHANEISLRASGVKQIEIAGISTYSNTNDWYSHRREMGKTGRFAAFITLLE